MRAGPLHPLAAVAVASIVLPLLALLARAPWGGVLDALADADVRSALVLSIGTATVAALLAVAVGVPLGWVLARDQRWSPVRPIVLLPLVLPPVVLGAGLHDLLGQDGLLGVDVAGTPLAVVLAQVVVAMPLCALAVESAVRRIDPRLEETAVLHGLRALTVARRVTLPAARPGIVAGAALAWARAVGEFGATVTVGGALPGRTEVVSTLVSLRLRSDPAAAHLLGLLILLVCVLVVVLLRDRIAVAPRDPGPGR